MARIALLLDHSGNRRMLQERLTHTDQVLGEAELDLEAKPPDLLIADPGGLGRWAARLGAAREAWAPRLLPVLLVVTGDQMRQAASWLGELVEDVVQKPLHPMELNARIRNLLRMGALSRDLQGQIADTAAYSRELEQRVKERTESLQQTLGDTVDRLTRASEFKDTDTGRHIVRVCYHARQIAEGLCLDPAFCERLFEATALHDVGKIAVPDRVLLKPGPLDDEEWQLMKRHTVDGHELLRSSPSSYLQLGAEIARSHHEHFDGTGYPDGLVGADIPLSGRLVQIADIYDALRAKRPYKEGLDHATARRIILEGDGRTVPEHFDPQVLAAFERCADAFEETQRVLAD